MKANTITNQQGDLVSHGALALTAQGDIKNLSGIINGGSVFLNSVHGDIVNETLLQSINQRIHGGDLNMSVASRVASISSSNGSVILKARDINNTGADLRSKNGSVILNASRDIHINALKEKRDFLDTHGKSKETSHRDTYTLSHIDTDGHTLQIQAGHDANLEAVQIKSKNSYVIAKNKVNITAVVDSDYAYKSKKKKSWAGLKKTKSLNETRFESVIGTTIDTDNLVISGDNGVGVESASITAGDSATIFSKNGDVEFTAKAYTTKEYYQKDKSYLGGVSKSHKEDGYEEHRLGSSSAHAKNQLMVKGKNVSLTATNMTTDNGGDIFLLADGKVSIKAGMESRTEIHGDKSAGLGQEGNVYGSTKDGLRTVDTHAKASNVVAGHGKIEDEHFDFVADRKARDAALAAAQEGIGGR